MPVNFPYLTVIKWGAVALLLIFIWTKGHEAGRLEVQEKWNAERAVAAEQLAKINADILDRERRHQQESQQNADALAEIKATHLAELAALERTYAARMRDSEARARRYSELAAAGPAEREHLASHAAELDRSLEEGRRLVEELKRALAARDAEAVTLGKQIITDRRVVSEAGH